VHYGLCTQPRLASEGRIRADTCGNKTEAVPNFVTRLDREFASSG
jgi:hypothetical protein